MEEILRAETIPAWTVALSWMYAGFIWIVTRASTIRMDSRIWGITFMLVGMIYMLGYIPSDRAVDLHTVKLLEFRLLFTRGLMILLSTSMWFPITVSYFRMRRRDGLDTNNNSSNRIG